MGQYPNPGTEILRGTVPAVSERQPGTCIHDLLEAGPPDDGAGMTDGCAHFAETNVNDGG